MTGSDGSAQVVEGLLQVRPQVVDVLDADRHPHQPVGEVRYPGFGAIISVVLAEGAMAADLLTRKTTLWVHATSLGGVESTFERRRRWKTEPATIPDGLVRMSVGIEDVDDLWDDLATALDDLVLPAG